jgi:hypothetical protein
MKPKGKAIELTEALSDEAATPNEGDIERAKEIVGSVSPLLSVMLEADPEDM